MRARRRMRQGCSSPAAIMRYTVRSVIRKWSAVSGTVSRSEEVGRFAAIMDTPDRLVPLSARTWFRCCHRGSLGKRFFANHFDEEAAGLGARCKSRTCNDFD